MLPISVCIIARNEEQHIEECLRRLLPYEMELIVIDTGSTDRTVSLAGKYTEHVYQFDWCDDFSAARNYAIGKASHDLILSLDCDEYLESLDQDALLALSAAPEHAGRILLCNRYREGGLVCYEKVRITRLADRRFYHFAGAVHEQLEPLSAQTKIVYDAPIEVLHVGYDLSDAQMQEKAKRNIVLLKKELEASPSDPYLCYQLGQSYRRLGSCEEALRWFDEGLSADVDPALSYVQTMIESYGYTLLDLKRYTDALQLENVYDVFSVRADFPFLMGLIYMNNGLFPQAVEEFQKASRMKEYSVDGVNSYKAHYNTGVIYECLGDAARAAAYYQKCGDYEPAKNRLSQIKLSGKKS